MFVDMEGVRRLGAPSLWVRNCKDVKVEFLPCSPSERVCHKGKNAGWFYMYTCVLVEIGVRFPFTEFECSALRQLNCVPAQIHPNSWGFIRAFEAKGVDMGVWMTVSSHQGCTVLCLFKASYKDFKGFYVKVRSAEDSYPFFLDENFSEKFPLYWNKSEVQCLGVEELCEKDAALSEFRFENLKGGLLVIDRNVALTASELTPAPPIRAFRDQ
ncbi:hypothetical protein PIB30_041597 [Stylosanthes scabra]|uniref:Uncharacterized protein n=1 Tax=Stylosanthes scabra TaxID=79078 RepID=A0ABU6UDL5_9FABA|nr:hypothetical protein [Stylosanthes scabra]